MDFFRTHKNILGVVAIVAVSVGVLYAAYLRELPEAQFVEYVQFVYAVERGEVEYVTMGDGAFIYFTMGVPEGVADIARNDGAGEGYLFYTNNPRRENLKEFLLINSVSVTEGVQSDFNVLQIGFTFAIVAGVLVFMRRRNSAAHTAGGINPVTVSAGADDGEKFCGFEDVAGNLEAKESVQDIVDYLRQPEKYARYGARMPRGILFHGKPGT